MNFDIKACFTDDLCIDGLFEIQPKIFEDDRGYFLEVYNEKKFLDAGLTMKFVQDNQSKSAKNVVRGLHFQKLHPQGKLIKAIDGKVFDVAVDLRFGSKTFGKHYGVILDDKKQNMFYIPEGFAHGFCVLSESAVVSYKCTDYYHPEDECGIKWNSSGLNIKWETYCPGISDFSILSEKDRTYSEFNKDNKYYDFSGKWIGN